MSVFGNYARYYDLLYRDKDYAGEAEFVHGLIRQFRPSAHELLELGCGTGLHAAELAKRGYSLSGVDRSPDMIGQARECRGRLPAEVAGRLDFSVGDARTIRLDREFDAVLALFHVLSYQTTSEDLRAVFEAVAAHLRPGGLFLFDVWYGPAVLTDRPAVRVKRLEDDAIQVMRVAEPVMYPRENVVDVNYTVLLRDKSTGIVEECVETHRMRYLFEPELQELARSNDMTLIEAGEWMSDRKPDFNTWSVNFVATKGMDG